MASAEPQTVLTAGQDFTILFQQNLNHYYLDNPGQLVADFASNANPVEGDFTPLGTPVADYNAVSILWQLFGLKYIGSCLLIGQQFHCNFR